MLAGSSEGHRHFSQIEAAAGKNVFQEGAVDVSRERLTQERLAGHRDGHESARRESLKIGACEQFFVRGDEGEAVRIRRGCDDAISGVAMEFVRPCVGGESDIHGDGEEFDAASGKRLSDPDIDREREDEFSFMCLLRDFNDAHGRESNDLSGIEELPCGGTNLLRAVKPAEPGIGIEQVAHGRKERLRVARSVFPFLGSESGVIQAGAGGESETCAGAHPVGQGAGAALGLCRRADERDDLAVAHEFNHSRALLDGGEFIEAVGGEITDA